MGTGTTTRPKAISVSLNCSRMRGSGMYGSVDMRKAVFSNGWQWLRRGGWVAHPTPVAYLIRDRRVSDRTQTFSDLHCKGVIWYQKLGLWVGGRGTSQPVDRTHSYITFFYSEKGTPDCGVLIFPDCNMALLPTSCSPLYSCVACSTPIESFNTWATA